MKLTEGTDYTYVVEGSDGSGTGCVVLTGMGDYRGTVEKTFKVKSNEVEPDSSEGKIDVSSAKFVGLAAMVRARCSPTARLRAKSLPSS